MDKAIVYPKDLKNLEARLHASQQEVTRLSNTISMQAEAMHGMRRDLEKWEQRFDVLLNLRR